jgi:RNA polymerase sigma factor (sigma-70 family)
VRAEEVRVIESMTTADVAAARLEPHARFTSAYREFAPAVRGYLRARGVDDPDAVTQDVFLALFPKLADLHGGAAGLRTLIFTIAHSRSVDHHRHRDRTPTLVEYDAENDRRTTPSAEDHAIEAQTGVLAAMNALAPEYREVLALRIIADLSQEVTAEIMGRSVGAVKQLQRRALLALRAEVAVGSGVLA